MTIRFEDIDWSDWSDWIVENAYGDPRLSDERLDGMYRAVHAADEVRFLYGNGMMIVRQRDDVMKLLHEVIRSRVIRSRTR